MKSARGVTACILGVVALLSSWGGAFASVETEGLPCWLEEASERSLEIVWSEIRENYGDEISQRKMLKLVSARLFTGYDFTILSCSGSDLRVRLVPQRRENWDVKLVRPLLHGYPAEWFERDIAGIGDRVLDLLEGVPLDALNWGDVALRKELEKIVSLRVPGWGTGITIRVGDGASVLTMTFTPHQPLVLAFVPRVESSTLPVFLRSDLDEDLLSALSPMVGSPVAWVKFHSADLEEWARSSLVSRKTVENSDSEVDVSISASQISRVRAFVESRRLTFQTWMAAYAGTDGRYPELGLFLGRKAQIFPRWNVELYGEWILRANDGDLESRWGIRWPLWSRFFVGVENVYPEEKLWYRMWLTGRSRAPYFWWRFSEDDEKNFGIGYRFNERLSIEVYYDDRDEEQLSLRAIGNL